MHLIAVDPGPVNSAVVVWDGAKPPIKYYGSNDGFLSDEFYSIFPLAWPMVIEKVACYGMPVGQDVFETVFFSGRLAERFKAHHIYRVERRDVKLHLCGTARAKDGNIIQALKDRFGDKGTKAKPGFFFGFSKDVWQAFALAVCFWDTEMAAKGGRFNGRKA